MSRRPLSPREAIVWSTLMVVLLGSALLTSYFHDSPAYRDGTAPERSGVVVSEPTHRHMTCGRSQDGYQVEVRYVVGSGEREEPLETCDPSALPEGTSVGVWERRPDLLTTAPPGEHHEMSIFLGVILALWALVVGWSVSRMRRTRRTAG
jgi:hypothetical protein